MEFTNQDYRGKYRRIPKIHRCCLTQHILINMNQLGMIQGRIGKRSTSSWGNETIVRIICSYQDPYMVGIDASTNKKHKFFNSTVQDIYRGGGDCATKVLALRAWLLIWNPQLKHMWKMGSVRSLISGVRPLMCLKKLFYLKWFGSLWWRRKENQ